MSTKTAHEDPQQPAGDPSPHGGQEVEDKVNEAAAKGYFGHRPDETPHEHYTLEGVIAGKPTPETEPSGPTVQAHRVESTPKTKGGE